MISLEPINSSNNLNMSFKCVSAYHLTVLLRKMQEKSLEEIKFLGLLIK